MEPTIPMGDTEPVLEPHQRLHNDNDVEIINRAKGEVQPFSEIKKRTSETSTGNITGYGIEIRDDSQDNGWRLAGNVGKNYLLVDNREVIEVAERIMQESPFAQTPRKIFFDGKRFIYSTVVEEEAIGGPRGDAVAFGLQFRNSYNGSQKFRAELYAERLVCENGMTTKDHFASHTFQHTIGNDGWQHEVEEAMSVLETAPDRLEHFVSDLNALENTTIDEQGLIRLRHSNEGLGELPVSRFGEVFDRLSEKCDRSMDVTTNFPVTGYDVLNAATNVLWHRDRSVRDLEYNEAVTEQLIDYAHTHTN